MKNIGVRHAILSRFHSYLLMGLGRRFEPKDIEAKIIEGTPIKAQNFKVRINNHTVTPRSLSGHRIPFRN